MSPPTRVTRSGVRTALVDSAPGSDARPEWPEYAGLAAAAATASFEAGADSSVTAPGEEGCELVVLPLTGSGILFGSLSNDAQAARGSVTSAARLWKNRVIRWTSRLAWLEIRSAPCVEDFRPRTLRSLKPTTREPAGTVPHSSDGAIPAIAALSPVDSAP